MQPPQPMGDAYFRWLVEHLGLAVVSTDRDLNIRTWNAAATRTFGAAAERVIGTPVAQILPRKYRRRTERMLRRTLKTGETIQIEFDHRDAEGHERQLAGTIAPVVDDAGERTGASVCVRDITRRIDLESELHESRKMVALGEMAGAIAHHFNNILGGVVTSIDFANASDDIALQHRVLQQVGPAVQRATSLVEGLLAFAGGDRRDDDLSDFTEIVNQVADEFESQSAPRSIDLTVSMPVLPVLSFPRTPVYTILKNIVQNAIEAMPDGGSLLIAVSLRVRAVIVRISDTGCGLDEAARKRIFEPFWSTKHGLREGSQQAAGLGLAVAHGLAKMIDGSITVTSEAGKGSCFIVTLPRPGSA